MIMEVADEAVNDDADEEADKRCHLETIFKEDMAIL